MFTTAKTKPRTVAEAHEILDDWRRPKLAELAVDYGLMAYTMWTTVKVGVDLARRLDAWGRRVRAYRQLPEVVAEAERIVAEHQAQLDELRDELDTDDPDNGKKQAAAPEEAKDPGEPVDLVAVPEPTDLE